MEPHSRTESPAWRPDRGRLAHWGHVVVVVVVAGWFTFCASQAPSTGANPRIAWLPPDWTPSALVIAVWGLGLLSLTLVPTYPLIGVLVFVAFQYGFGRYGPHTEYARTHWLPEWIAGLTALGWGVRQYRVRRWPELPPSFFAPIMVLFVAWIGVTTAVAYWSSRPWNPELRHHPVLYLEDPLFFLVAATFADRPSRFILLTLVLGGSVVVRTHFLTAGGSRDEDLAALAIMTFPLALFGALSRTILPIRITLLLLTAHMGWVVYVARNRGAGVAFLVVAIVLWLQSRFRAISLLLMAPLAVAFATIFRSTEFWRLYIQVLEKGRDVGNVDQRVRLWEAAWRMFGDHPVFGVGPGNYSVVVEQYLPLHDKTPHNSLLGIVAEAGILGGVLYAILFLGVPIMLWRVMRRSRWSWPAVQARAVLTSLCAYLTIGMFISRSDMVLAYILLGAGVALITSWRREVSTSQENGRSGEPALPPSNVELEPNES